MQARFIAAETVPNVEVCGSDNEFDKSANIFQHFGTIWDR
jgi:hypothetical protein